MYKTIQQELSFFDKMKRLLCCKLAKSDVVEQEERFKTMYAIMSGREDNICPERLPGAKNISPQRLIELMNEVNQQ